MSMSPIILRIFQPSQLEQSVTVNVISYEKRREKIIIWFKKNDNEWVVLSSIRFTSKSVAF